MTTILILLFVVGYLAITLEHPIKLDKTVPALLMSVLMWALLSIGFQNGWFTVINELGQTFNINAGNQEEQLHGFHGILIHHLSKTAEILIFLIGAMTIVELIDAHDGFQNIAEAIKTTHKTKLVWLIALITFYYAKKHFSTAADFFSWLV